MRGWKASAQDAESGAHRRAQAAANRTRSRGPPTWPRRGARTAATRAEPAPAALRALRPPSGMQLRRAPNRRIAGPPRRGARAKANRTAPRPEAGDSHPRQAAFRPRVDKKFGFPHFEGGSGSVGEEAVAYSQVKSLPSDDPLSNTIRRSPQRAKIRGKPSLLPGKGQEARFSAFREVRPGKSRREPAPSRKRRAARKGPPGSEQRLGS